MFYVDLLIIYGFCFAAIFTRWNSQ